MKKEYVVWGIPPLGKFEEVLFTLADSQKEADRVCEILTEQDGCTECRVQVIDFNDKTNLFKKAIQI